MSMLAVRGTMSMISTIRAGIATHISASLRPDDRRIHYGIHLEFHGSGRGRTARQARVGLPDSPLEAHAVGAFGGRGINDSAEQTSEPRFVLCGGGEDGDCTSDAVASGDVPVDE